MMKFDIDETTAALEKLLELPFDQRLGIVSREPSNVVGSPHDYLYVYLSDRGAEGPFVLVSDRQEFEPEHEGWYVGGARDWDDFESGDNTAESYDTLADAMNAVWAEAKRVTT